MEPTAWQKFLSEFVAAVLPILSLLLIYATTILRSYLKSKIKNETALTALNTVNGIIEMAVVDIGATIKADVLKAKEDGKITKEEGLKIKQHALDRINTIIPAEMQKSIAPLIANLEAYINSRIEAVVEETK